MTEQKEETKTRKKINGSTALGWFFGILCFFTGAILLFTKPVAGFLYLFAGVIVFPPYWRFVQQQRNWKYTPPRALKIILFLIFFGLAGAVNGTSSNQSSPAGTTPATAQKSNATPATDTPEPTEAPTATPKPTLTPQQIIAQFEQQGQTVTVAAIYKTPNSYKGKSLIFTCTVSGFPKDENGDVAALNCSDPNDYGSNLQVGIGKNTDVTKINENDTIKVYGLGLGAIQGKNAFGGDITTGGILGLYIKDITTGYQDY